jgi:putative glycosyltransferase (TIGR04372 family)
LIRVGRINSLRIVHMLLEIDWYLSEPQKPSLDLFYFTTSTPVNSFLADFAKRKMIFFPRIMIFAAYIVNRILPGGGKYLVSLPFESFDFQIFDSSPSPFSTTLNFKKNGEELLKKMQISETSPIVCFYVRDEMYGEKTFPYLNQDFSKYRNSNIDDFLPAMEYLASQGFTVIRMGREGKQQVFSENPKIIDYCFSDYKSDFADFFITSKAEFAVCTDTGMTHLPLFFRKPIGIANIVGMHGLLHTKMVRYVTFKRYFDKVKMRKLALSEILSSELVDFKDNRKFVEANIKFIDSSPEELVGLAQDMMFNTQSPHLSSYSNSEQDNKFQDFVSMKRGIKMWSRISNSWLKNNQDFLE